MLNKKLHFQMGKEARPDQGHLYQNLQVGARYEMSKNKNKRSGKSEKEIEN